MSVPVTIKTVASAAGVHPSTVSRALRPDADPTSATTQRIRALAESLGYLPTLAGASLRTGRSNTIGVLVHSLTDVVQATVFQGVERAAADAGFQAIVANTGDDPDEQRRRAALLVSHGVDGLVLADARTDDSGHVRWLHDRGRPFALVIRGDPDHVSVTLDDARAGRSVGAHLADLGHRTVAVLAGPAWSRASLDRALGAVAALSERGVAPDDELMIHGGLDTTSGQEAARRVLDQRPDVTAIFAVNDFMALGVMIELRERGLEPGADVAVVGFNDIDIAAAAQLTTIHSPHDQLGRLAFERVHAIMRGEDAQSVCLPPELVVRASSGPVS